MKRFLSLAAVFAFGLALCAPAAAQYLVVAACPNVAAIYATGQSNRVATVDIYGTVCTSGSGGGGGGGSVTQGTVPWVVTGAGGTFPVTGTFFQATQPVSATALPLPTGAATSALQSTINTTLGSPFQAGASIGNTAFGISGTLPAFAATPTFNIGTAPTIAVTGTFFQATQPVSAASLPLPSGAATAANQATMATNQTGGGQKTQIVDGSGNVISSTANALDINIKSGSATVAASENHLGEVGGNILPITNGMTTSNATVTTGQSIGGIQTLANAVRVSGSLGASGTSGIIQSVVLTFLDAVGSGPLDVYFYNATVTTGSNCQNATTFVLQTADRTNVLGIVHVTDFTSSNTAVVMQANNLAIPFGLASSTSLFACVVARASFVITGTTNASIKVNVLRN